MSKLSTIKLTILLVAGCWGVVFAEEGQFYETVISTDKFPKNLTFDHIGNPYAVLSDVYGNWLYRWMDGYWDQEMVPSQHAFPFRFFSIDSGSFPHLIFSSTHVYKTDSGWQTEQLPFPPTIVDFDNPASPMVANYGNSSLPDTLDIRRATKSPSGWQVTVSTISGTGISKGFFEEDGVLFLANIINNQLKIFKIDGPSTEIVLDRPVVGSLLGFERDPENQFHVLTSSQNICYPPLSVSEGFRLEVGQDFQYSQGSWLFWDPGNHHITNFNEYRLTGNVLVGELVSTLIIRGEIYSPYGNTIRLGGDLRPFYLTRAFHLSGETTEGLYPTLTAKLPPPAPVTVSARTTGAIRWAWAPRTSEIVTGYRVRRGGDNADLSGLLAPTVNSWTQSGFSPNTQSTVYLETIYPGFVLPSTPLTAASAGVRPGSVRLDRGSSGRLSAAWSAEGNPAGIQYRVDLHAPDGTVFSQTAGSPNHVFPSLTTQMPYALNVNVLSSDGSGVPLSTVDVVETDGRRVRMGFTVDGVTVEAVISPAGNFLSPILAAAPVSTFPTGVADGLTSTGRGFQLEMDHSLPDGQSATVSVVYPAGWLDATVPEPWVLARYDSAHGVWIALPTRREGQRLTASVDGFGTFQVMGRTGGGGIKPLMVYPNPFRLSEGASLVVREVPQNARAMVMTMDGRLIRSVPGNESGLAQWDGTDGNGEKIKSGVYVISVESDGETKKMKVIVER